jgi:[protein-PII] uridylyltransferase
MTGRLPVPNPIPDLPDLETLNRCPADPAAFTAVLREQLLQYDRAQAARFRQGDDTASLVLERAWALEQLLLATWTRLIPPTHGLTLVAVGGFGRGELHPYSDIDLLILTGESSLGGSAAEAVEQMVRVLWDAGFYLGHSVRSLAQCVEDAAADIMFATNLLESRFLAGAEHQYEALMVATGPDRIWPADRFFQAKCEEQMQRYQQYNQTAYNLEPNIKEGPGGLRDIQMLAWVAKRLLRTNSLRDIIAPGYLLESEYRHLVDGMHYLWKIRFAIHLEAGRAEDRLLFGYQREIARRFGFSDDTTGNLAVEQFMQQYYRRVVQLERLNERLLQLFDEQLLQGSGGVKRSLSEDFVAVGAYLEAADDGLFQRKPLALLELFLTLQRNPELKGVRAATIRLVRENIGLIDEAFRNNSEARNMFMALLGQSHGVYSQLQRMNRYGVLAAYLPAFAAITGRMQFDLFHNYTVDQHILFVIRNLRRFAYGKYQDKYPHGQEVFERIDKPELLYLAALFHDIAKGRGGDHSDLGAADAAIFCRDHGLEPADQRLVSWLVENHLLMSTTAQRQDITEPAVIHEFAQKVGDYRHLDHLYLLTMADISATSPKLWNTWKDSLLWQLYGAASHALRRGLENPLDRDLIIAETRAEAMADLAAAGFDKSAVQELWADLPPETALRFSPAQLVWVSAGLLSTAESPQVLIRERSDHGVSELLVYAEDYSGLFAAVTGELENMRINILSARVMTSARDYACNLFELMDTAHGPLNERDANRLHDNLVRVLGEKSPGSVPVGSMPGRLQHFVGATLVNFSVQPVSGFTVMELECTDRPGLLSQIARIFLQQGISVQSRETGEPLDQDSQEDMKQAILAALDE